MERLVGGPGYEPGASRSRTVLVACPRVSCRLRKGLLNSTALAWCPEVTPWSRAVPGMRDPAVTGDGSDVPSWTNHGSEARCSPDRVDFACPQDQNSPQTPAFR